MTRLLTQRFDRHLRGVSIQDVKIGASNATIRNIDSKCWAPQFICGQAELPETAQKFPKTTLVNRSVGQIVASDG